MKSIFNFYSAIVPIKILQHLYSIMQTNQIYKNEASQQPKQQKNFLLGILNRN
jgi:hypothetical protein